MSNNGKRSALFVCLGNICRSPIAEAVFKQLVEEQGCASEWHIDSAATSRYQIGSPPYHRGQKCMKKNNIYHHVKDHRGRQITKHDFMNFDYIFGMDDSNMSDLQDMSPKNCAAKFYKLGTFNTDTKFAGIIEDPYYNDNDDDFDTVYEQCVRSCRNFLDSITN